MTTLWSPGRRVDPRLLESTTAEDRPWDARLLRWDVLGSLGHVEGLRAAGLLSARDHVRIRRGLRQALRTVDQGRLRRRSLDHARIFLGVGLALLSRGTRR